MGVLVTSEAVIINFYYISRAPFLYSFCHLNMVDFTLGVFLVCRFHLILAYLNSHRIQGLRRIENPSVFLALLFTNSFGQSVPLNVFCYFVLTMFYYLLSY